MCLDTTVYVTKSGWHCIVCEKWRLCCFSLPTCLARRRRRLWSLRNVPCSPITWATVMYLPSISPSHHPGCHTDIYHKPPYCGSDPGDIMRARWAFEGTSEWKQQIFFFFLKQNFVTSCCTFPFFDKGADTSNTLLEAGSLKQDARKKKKRKGAVGTALIEPDKAGVRLYQREERFCVRIQIHAHCRFIHGGTHL